MAVLVDSANAGAFARRSGDKSAATERAFRVSVLPQVPAFVNQARSGRSQGGSASRRSSGKSEQAAGYRLEASLMSLDGKSMKKNH